MKRNAFEILKNDSTVSMRLRKKDEQISISATSSEYEQRSDLKIRKSLSLENLDDQWQMIVRFYNSVLVSKEFDSKIPFMRRFSLWIQGKPGVGKTLFMNQLIVLYKCYMIQKDELQNEPYIGPYDLILVDEYAGEKPITWLNELTTGEYFQIRQRGGGTHKKTDKIPVFVFSNFTMDELYKSETALDALRDRFFEIKLTQFGNPFKIDMHPEYQQELDNIVYGKNK